MRKRETEGHAHSLLEVGSYKFKRVQELKFLGLILTQNNDDLIEIKTRHLSDNTCYCGL